MSAYTMQVRTICEQYYLNQNPLLKPWEVMDVKPKTICSATYQNVFDFDFPQLSSMSKQDLCTMILMHYYMREIGLETVGLWKQFLETRLNEIMPYYVSLEAAQISLADAMENRNIQETVKRSGTENEDTKNKLDGTQQGTNDRESDSTVNRENNGKNLFSDTPQNGLEDVQNGTYLTDATYTNDIALDSSKSTDLVTTDTTVDQTQTGSRDKEYGENVSRETFGFEGDKVETVMKYRETILQIPRMIINDLSDLFISILN